VEELIRVSFRTFGPPASIMGTNHAEMTLSGNTVKEFLNELELKHNGIRKILRPSGDQLSDLIYILVNGTNIHSLNGLDTILNDGDIISLLPVTAGG